MKIKIRTRLFEILAVIVVAALLQTLFVIAEARGEVRKVPFTVAYRRGTPYVEVTYSGSNGKVFTKKCGIDTAAEKIWMSFNACEATGDDLTIARNAIAGGNTSTVVRHPGCKPLNITVGGFTWTNFQEGRAWWELSDATCLVGYEMFWRPYMTWIFEHFATGPGDETRGYILTFDSAAESDSYWMAHWEACKVGLGECAASRDFWEWAAHYWRDWYCWALTLSGNRC